MRTLLLAAVASLAVTLHVAFACTGSTAYTQSTATLSSGYYGNYDDCQWLIAPTGGATSILIQFSTFNTESDYDFLRIYAGRSASGSAITVMSGDLGARTVTVPGCCAFLRFTSDVSITRSGFTATYYTTATGTGECSGVQSFTQETAYITPGSYPDSECAWIFSVPSASWIRFSFSNFPATLSNDVISIYQGTSDNPSNLVATRSGGSVSSVTVFETAAFMTYQKNSSLPSNWLTTVTSYIPVIPLCSGSRTLTETTGQFGSGGSGGYNNHMNCRWTILGARDSTTAIIITFTEFNTERRYDPVSVYTGPNDGEQEQVDSFSGSYSTPFRVIVRARSALVIFTSDVSITRRGFSATYVISEDPSYLTEAGNTLVVGSPCMGTGASVYGAFGYFDDGSDSNDYLPHQSCRWTITASPNTTQIMLRFGEFATQNHTDTVKVYSNVGGNNKTQVATFWGEHQLPVVNVTGSIAIVEFDTDSSVQMEGWLLFFATCTPQYGCTRWATVPVYRFPLGYLGLIIPASSIFLSLIVCCCLKMRCCKRLVRKCRGPARLPHTAGAAAGVATATRNPLPPVVAQPVIPPSSAQPVPPPSYNTTGKRAQPGAQKTAHIDPILASDVSVYPYAAPAPAYPSDPYAGLPMAPPTWDDPMAPPAYPAYPAQVAYPDGSDVAYGTAPPPQFNPQPYGTSYTGPDTDPSVPTPPPN